MCRVPAGCNGGCGRKEASKASRGRPGREESNGRGETLLGAGKKLPRGAAKMCLLA